jgi:hypothetical protein
MNCEQLNQTVCSGCGRDIGWCHDASIGQSQQYHRSLCVTSLHQPSTLRIVQE